MSYQSILKMPASELVNRLKIPNLMIRRIPDEKLDCGSAMWCYLKVDERVVADRDILTCLDSLKNPLEYLLTGGGNNLPDTVYAVFKNRSLLEDKNDVLKLIEECYKNFRKDGGILSKEQTDLYFGELRVEQNPRFKGLENSKMIEEYARLNNLSNERRAMLKNILLE